MAQAGAQVAQSAPGMLREGGALLTRLFGPRSPETVSVTALVSAGNAPPTEDDARPRDVPFPHESASQQARPAAVHAHENGYPTQSVAARIGRGDVIANLLALLTCGAIFGSSIGLLLGFIDPDAMAVAAGRQLIVWGVCSIFGIFLFYILGRTAETLFALISEQYHAALVATHRKNPGAVGQWLKRGGNIYGMGKRSRLRSAHHY
jgi:hypothetical protein